MLALTSTVESVSMCSQSVGNDNTGYLTTKNVPVSWHLVDNKSVRGYYVCKPCFGEISILMLALASTVESVSMCSQSVGNENTGYLTTKNACGHSCSILI